MLRKLSYIFATLVSTALLSGCNDDDSLTQPADKLQVLPLSSSFVDVQPITRADYLPDGYVTYSALSGARNADNANIGIFMTPYRINPREDCIYLGDNNTWLSTILYNSRSTYYMYGIMPRSVTNSEPNCTIAPLGDTNGEDKGYAAGAIITLSSFPAFTTSDLCVTTGARKATQAEISSKAIQEPVKLGKFVLTPDNGTDQKDHYAIVLLKHLYASLNFQAVIDPDYHTMRTIKLTKVELIASINPGTVTMTITITANDTSTDPVTVTYTAGSSIVGKELQIYPSAEESATEYELPESNPSQYIACFAPTVTFSSLSTRVTYNVYDRKGNLTRKGCVATNKVPDSMTSAISALEAGHSYTLNYIVKPTYLYVLSEPELDNPTFDITSN